MVKYLSCTLKIETDQQETFQCKPHCEGVLESLHARVDLCDIVLIAGNFGKRISAHRLVLIASSAYFSGLLTKPVGDNQGPEIIINNLDGDALEKLVTYCYTGSLELRGDTVGALLTTAMHLQLEEVVVECVEFLQRHLQPSNCLPIAVFAEELNFEVLFQCARNIIYKNFEEVSNYPEFLLLPFKIWSSFITMDEFCVTTNEFLFEVLIRWIEYDPEKRRQHLIELLSQLKLHFLSPSFLITKVEPLCDTPETQKLFVNALKSHLLTSSYIQSRNSGNVTLLGIYQRNKNLEIAAYNLRTKAGFTWPTSIQFQQNSVVGLMDDKLIVVGGGIKKKSAVTTVRRLDLHTMVSTEMAPLEIGRRDLSVVVLNRDLYAIGGSDGSFVLKSVERWDAVSRRWNLVAPMLNGRQHPAAALINNHLYVCGGYSSGCLSSMECYDPVQNIWIPKASMSTQRYKHCLLAHKGYLFAIGGFDKVNETTTEIVLIERYDPSQDTWTTITCTPTISGAMKCASIGADIFIYKNKNIYKIITEGNCESLKMELFIKNDHDFMQQSFESFISVPYEFTLPISYKIT